MIYLLYNMGDDFIEDIENTIRNIKSFNKTALVELIEKNAVSISPDILGAACNLKEKYYGKKVYIRGLIEFTNYCKNNCFYCGIRKDSKNIKRYRLTKEQIIGCCVNGWELGYRTFVLQGGEDLYYSDDYMCGIIGGIKDKFPECAVTLSFGEHTKETYRKYFSAGADRYLLRHETAESMHYAKLHPSEMSLEHRKACLYNLKETGFQVGAGFMVGSPHQTYENLAADLLFLKELKPHMTGIGPFIPAENTPFKNFRAGSLNLALLMIALTRILLPDVLLPSTTALGTIHPDGREMGLKAGCNVVMANLSPSDVRASYALYDNKEFTGDEAAESIKLLKSKISAAGFEPSTERGLIRAYITGLEKSD